MLTVVIITYNIHTEIFLMQIEAIRKYCKDEFVIEVVDNSSKPECADAIRYHAGQAGVNYLKTFAIALDGSASHSFAANFSYQRFKDNGSQSFLYLDHDAIPVREFSVDEILGEDKIIAGIGQLKRGLTYFWPGLLFFRNDKIDNELIDFSPQPGLDTGGALYKVIEKYGMDACVFFNEAYHQNPGFVHNKYGYFSAINDEMFYHCVNGSNWAGAERQDERINSFINIIKEKTGI